MVIREYAACEECGQAHILRIGLGSQRLQKHLFACRECGLEMGLTLEIGKGTRFGPNAVRIAATEDAPSDHAQTAAAARSVPIPHPINSRGP